ncbi:hypothetical protein [Sporanaerobacter acetigenes]|uniref:DUF4365 domain-containing protein n=1 Tax=Sporanaerobacter acetigenes DSM 13106 TaxID=1123281 RepID=A0A1M5YI89_9FIRM|nr:hypothetical protein [Sporanaerobacter acetigenes]SHI11223.1 hypothetical protein SAMN02745180_02195 [Sporanaerobacter acetigenes DSM 13106]
MDIEIIATSSIEKLISRNSYLKPAINNNDKIPVWDGDVIVYGTKDLNKKKENLIGRVPVQVKGHKVENISDSNLQVIKFRVKKEDMKKYLTDGGVIYFVVYIDEDTEKIFYNSLLPLDLERLIKRYDNQKTFEIEFKSLPTKDRELADVFLDFIQNRKRQQGTLIPGILYTDDIEKIQNEIKEFKFSYSTIEPKGSIPFRELTTRDFYLYAKPKGIGNPIPFERVSNAIINIQHKFKISVGEKTYYEDAYIQWEKGQSRIVCGKSVTLNLKDTTSSNIGLFNINVKFKGTLNEQLNDLYFIKALINTEELIIDGHSVPYSNFKFDNNEHLFARISDLELLKQRLEYYGVKTDFNLEAITEEDDFKISFLMDEKPSMKRYKINLAKAGVLGLEIANISILLFAEENIEEGYYKIKSYFENAWKVKYYLRETDEDVQMSQFLILDKKGLLADNINSRKIIEDIKRNHSGNKNIVYVNTFLLEAIKAYDEYSPQQMELRYLIENLSEWLYNESKEDYIFLNLAQVKYRLGTLDKYDIDKIIDIGKLNKDNIEIQAGISILLKKKEDAKELIKDMNSELKDLFMSYPIYHLLENSEQQNTATNKD